MPHPYTEEQLVEQPAIGLFAELGWQTVSASEEVYRRSRGDEPQLTPADSQSLLTSSSTVCLGRETKSEVMLVSRLRAALERLNPALPPEANPAPPPLAFTPRVYCLITLADAIRQRTNPGPVDVSAVLERVNSLLDESIEGVTMTDHPVPVLDLSKISFEALARQFRASPRKQLELEDLKAAIRRLLDRLIRLNRTRIDFQEKFEELIEAYNAGSKNIEELFQQLLDLSRSLTEEEQRHVREHLTEEELTVFDLLTRPGPELTPAEREEVKKAARHLLERVKQVLVLDWRQRGTARARVRLAIEDTLDDELPSFTQKVSTVFEHIYEAYPGESN